MMVVEILFQEVCGLYGDCQNPTYLQATLPEAKFVFTNLNHIPYFVENTPDLIYIGAMSEATQRTVIAQLQPYKSRILDLVDNGTVILATGNAGEIFCKRINYVTEEISTEALGVFDLEVTTDLFHRYNGKNLGTFEQIPIVGFRSQFSMIHGDNTGNFFLKCERGIGINPKSDLEGMRKNNLICTQMIGPILPLNPLFCEYLIGLTGHSAIAAFKEAAMDAYEQRLREFRDPKVNFNH